MKRVAVANLKGGVGKSTTTLFLSEHWAFFQDRKILVVDLDPQANASYMLLSRDGVAQAENARKTLPHLFADAAAGNRRGAMSYIEPRASDLLDLDGRTRPGLVSILPSIPKLWFQQHDFDRDAYSTGCDPVEVWIEVLTDLLREVDNNYECVLFDCPPGFGTLSRAALRLADQIVAPTIADYTSMRSLQDFVTLGLSETLQIDVNQNLHVVISKFAGTNSQQGALEFLRMSYRIVPYPIPMRDQVQVVAERHATRFRSYARKYERPLYRPLKPHVKGMSDALYNAIFQP